MYTRHTFQPDGIRFAGAAVMPVGPLPSFGPGPELEIETESPEPEADQALTQTHRNSILDLVVESNPQSKALERLKAELISELVPLGERVDQYVAAIAAEHQNKLERRLEEAREEGQRQTEIAARSEQEFRQSEQLLAQAKNVQSEASLLLREHRDNPPGRFVRKAGRAAYARKDRELIRACREADRAEHEAMVARNQAAERCNRENAELARIAAEVDRLEAAAKGKKIHDPLTGIFGIPEV